MCWAGAPGLPRLALVPVAKGEARATCVRIIMRGTLCSSDVLCIQLCGTATLMQSCYKQDAVSWRAPRWWRTRHLSVFVCSSRGMRTVRGSRCRGGQVLAVVNFGPAVVNFGPAPHSHSVQLGIEALLISGRYRRISIDMVYQLHKYMAIYAGASGGNLNVAAAALQATVVNCRGACMVFIAGLTKAG